MLDLPDLPHAMALILLLSPAAVRHAPRHSRHAGPRATLGRVIVALHAVALAASLWLCASVLGADGAAVVAGDFWRVDALSALLALCITA